MSGRKKDVKKVAVNFAMEEKLKNDWMDICDELGMSISGAITLLAKQMVRERKFPFTPDATVTDRHKKQDDILLEVQGNRSDMELKRMFEYFQMMQERRDNK